jgi:hypothetical protein
MNKAKITLIAAIAALSLATPALAQSAYTTGSAASNAAAGYPSPYGNGNGIYDYAPGYSFGHGAHQHQRRDQTDFYR